MERSAQTPPTYPAPQQPYGDPSSRSEGSVGVQGEEMPFGSALLALRRNRGLMLAWVIGTFALAAGITFSLQPRYRASALVMLDTRELNLSEVRTTLTGPANTMDPNIARGEVEVLSSEGLARRVITDLRLTEKPEFGQAGSIARRLAAGADDVWQHLGAVMGLSVSPLFPQARISGDDEATRIASAVGTYRKAFSVFNDGRSYTISLGFQSDDPALAARILNRHVELYIEAQRQFKTDALAVAGQWLSREVDTLAGRLRDAERAVQNHREQNGLFAPRGLTVIAQQLGEVNGQLALARAEVAAREAKFRSAQEAVRRGGGGSSESEVTVSQTISRLREQEASAARRYAQAASQFGERHPIVLAAKAEVKEIQRKIDEEVQKVLQGLSSDAGIARDRAVQLQRTVTELEQRMAQTERAEATARDLEREAAATRSLYEALLARQKQVQAQEGTQRADARLISPAVPPVRPSFPNVPLFLAVALVGSTGSGLGLALMRDRFRSRVESLEGAETAASLPGLGVIPRAPKRSPLHVRIVEAPKSAAAESVRALRTSLAVSAPVSVRRKRTRVLVVTSAQPNEGKTTVAISLARSMAGSGLNVLLIDADFRLPNVGRLVWGSNVTSGGLVSALSDGLPLGEVVRTDPKTPLHVLPAEQRAQMPPPQDLLGSPAMRKLLAAAVEAHDFIIVDTPPVGTVSDASIVAGLADAVLVVSRWKRTPVAALRASVRSLRASRAPLAGVVLNDADPRRLPAHSGGVYAMSAKHGYFDS